MRVRRAATYLVDPATGEERLVENSEGAADPPVPEDAVGEIPPAGIIGGADAPGAEEDDA